MQFDLKMFGEVLKKALSTITCLLVSGAALTQSNLNQKDASVSAFEEVPEAVVAKAERLNRGLRVGKKVHCADDSILSQSFGGMSMDLGVQKEDGQFVYSTTYNVGDGENDKRHIRCRFAVPSCNQVYPPRFTSYLRRGAY